MKLKNISIGDFIEAKNRHGGDVGLNVLEIGRSYEVLGFNEDSDLTVIISVPEHKTFHDGFYVCHKCFRKPRPQLKQLDRSVFDGLDEKWRWFGVNSDGSTIRATDKPKINVSNNGFILLIGDSEFSDDNYDTSNWQNSLIERDTAKELLEVDLSSELTGSELCMAMLARGDKYVMCMTSSGVDIIDNLDCPLSSTCPFIGYLDNYSHVVPINNQGEPLTANEVGL